MCVSNIAPSGSRACHNPAAEPRSSPEARPAAPALQVSHAISEVSDIIFFLLGAMTIVEEVNCHQGFDIISRWAAAAAAGWVGDSTVCEGEAVLLLC